MKYTDKKERKSSYDKLVNLNSRLVALDENLKNMKSTINFNESVFNAGGMWFEEGYDLNEAKDKFKLDENFIRGYKHMERLYQVHDDLYIMGRNCYLNGVDLSLVPESKNKYFLEGYNDAMNLDKKHRR